MIIKTGIFFQYSNLCDNLNVQNDFLESEFGIWAPWCPELVPMY